MPELPEVETTRAGIAPHLQGAVIQSGYRSRAQTALARVSTELAQMATGQRGARR